MSSAPINHTGSRILPMAAAILLAVVSLWPGTGRATPTVTASPNELMSNSSNLVFDLFLLVDIVDVAGAALQITSSGGTTFTNVVDFDINHSGGSSPSLSTEDPQLIGFTLGPVNGVDTIPIGTQKFATVTLDTGSMGANVVLANMQYLQAPFCSVPGANVGSTLVMVAPEASSAALLGIGLLGLGWLRRRWAGTHLS